MSPAAAAGARSSEARDGVPVVDAVVVDYRSGALLGPCLDSLRAAGVRRTVVVDNFGTAGSAESATTAAEAGAEWIASGANLGYGRAANLGAARLDAPLLLVANPDLTVEPGAVATLAARLDAEPALGAVGPRITNPDGTLYPSARHFPDMVDAIGHGLLGSLNPDNRWTARYRMLDWDHASPVEVDWVSGAFVVVRRRAWEAVGGFDPAYFMYMEDVDLCWRLGRAGWGIGYDPGATVTHVQGASAGLHPYRMLAAHHRAMWRFARGTTTGARRAALPLIGAGLAFRWVAMAAEHRLGVAAGPATRTVPPGGAG